VTNYSHVTPQNVAALQAAIAQTPTCVSIHAGQELLHYAGGIFNPDNCETVPNHAVLAVGYGKEGD
jgi:hypothetical protein